MLALVIFSAIVGLGITMGLSSDDTETETDSNDLPDPRDIEREYETPDRTGTGSADLLQGSAEDNTIDGRGGDDRISGFRGNDTLYGGRGDDTLLGGSGDDNLVGGRGNDYLDLGPGNDVVDSRLTELSEFYGDDTISGGDGHDWIADGFGSNEIHGGAGNDMLIAVDGADSAGRYNTVSERGTADTITGGDGNDTIIASDGDVVSGGAGRDDLYVLHRIGERSFTPDPVEVTDFDTSEDVLIIRDLDRGADVYNLSMRHDPDQGGLRVFVGEQEVAFLRGLTANDIQDVVTQRRG